MRGSKDAALAFAARSLLNAKLGGICEVTNFSLDSANQAIQLQIVLRGEPQPVAVNVHRYEIQRSSAGAILTVLDADASREWLTALLHEFALGRPIPIPSKAAVALKLLT